MAVGDRRIPSCIDPFHILMYKKEKLTLILAVALVADCRIKKISRRQAPTMSGLGLEERVQGASMLTHPS